MNTSVNRNHGLMATLFGAIVGLLFLAGIGIFLLKLPSNDIFVFVGIALVVLLLTGYVLTTRKSQLT